MIYGDSLILLDVMKVGFATYFILSRQSFSQAHHFRVCYLYVYFFLLPVQVFWWLYIFYLVGCKNWVSVPHACTLNIR